MAHTQFVPRPSLLWLRVGVELPLLTTADAARSRIYDEVYGGVAGGTRCTYCNILVRLVVNVNNNN